MEDLRVYPTRTSQGVLDRAISVRSGRAELLHAYIDVEPATYNRGFYNVDVRYYYKVTAEASTGSGRPAEVSGLAVFGKRVLLFGSEAGAKSFSSREAFPLDCCGGKPALPEAIIEAVDPIVLSLKLSENCGCLPCDPCAPPCPPPCPPNPCSPCPPPPPPCGAPCGPCGEGEITDLPACVLDCFDGELSFDPNGRRLYVTLGQFSIIRLEREAQLLIPMYDYCLPTRECSGAPEDDREDDPCEIFRQIRFPVGEFVPSATIPDGGRFPEGGSGCGRC